MKRTMLVLLVTGLSAFGCGPYEVHVNDVKVDGNITHTLKFDVEDLKKYFQAECEQEVPASQVQDCVDAKIGRFLSFMSASPSPTPTQ